MDTDWDELLEELEKFLYEEIIENIEIININTNYSYLLDVDKAMEVLNKLKAFENKNGFTKEQINQLNDLKNSLVDSENGFNQAKKICSQLEDIYERI